MTLDLLLVAISLFTWGLGEGMFLIFQPLYLQQMGVNPQTIGVILGGAGIAMSIAQLPAGYLSDRIGQRPLMWVSWVMGMLATGVMAIAGSTGWFVGGILLYGMTGFVTTPLNSYLAAARGRLGVGRALTFVQSLYNFGAVIGPSLGGWIAQQFSISVIYRWAFLIFGFSTLIIFFIKKHDFELHAEDNGLKSFKILKDRRFLSLLPLVFLTIFVTYLPQPLAPNFLQNQRLLTLSEIGRLGSIGSLGTAVIMLVLGNLNPSTGLVLGQVCVGIFAFLLWRGTSQVWYGLGFFFMGGFRLSRYMILAFTRSLVHISSTGLAFGTVEMMDGMGVFLAPLLAGLLYSIQPELIFIASLVLIGICIVLNVRGLTYIQNKYIKLSEST
jgi:hypothetical protein